MRKFLGFEMVNVGTHQPEGKIWLTVDAIVALEQGNGPNMTRITIAGGRSIFVLMPVDEVKRLLSRPRAKAPRPAGGLLSEDFLRDFFNLRRA